MLVQDLINRYKEMVKAIPECRPCVKPAEEVALETINHLQANHVRSEQISVLMKSCMVFHRGLVNPNHVSHTIKEWLETQ